MLRNIKSIRQEKRKNILFCFGQSRCLGGTEIEMFSIMAKLNAANFKPFAIFPEKGKVEKIFKARGLNTKIIPINDWRKGKKILLDYLNNNHIKIIHLNTLHMFEFNAAILAKSIGIPVVWHIHCKIDTAYPHLKENQSANILHFICTLSNRIITCSNYAKRQFIEAGCSNKVVTVHNGVDINNFRPYPGDGRDVLRNRLGIKKNDFLVAMVGRLSPEKRHADFIKAAALVKDKLSRTKFVVIGGESSKKYLSYLRKINRCNNNPVTFAGFYGCMQKAMRSIDLLVLNSINDAFPVVILEAMACGKPVVATRSGGIPEMVLNGKTGILINPKKPSELASAIISVIKHPGKSALMGKRGRERAERFFDLRKATKKIEEIYFKALNSR